jgi:hypothetical protein
MSKIVIRTILLLILVVVGTGNCSAEPAPEPRGNHPEHSETVGSITTLWPIFDYRSSPATGYSNLSILGPIFKREHSSGREITALRPLFYSNSVSGEDDRDILYPLASTSSSSRDSDSQVLKLFQSHVSYIGTPEEKHETMLFPFYISGQSEKFGPYTSFFPFYGDIYGRFWRDEYHFTLFPIYGRTVNKGTTSTNYLYPFFNTKSGEKESGFAFWPFYGESAKEGVYRKRFILWPFHFSEELRKDSDNPTENFYLLPFYASSRSPSRTATHVLWPFVGVVRDGSGNVIERDFIWPLWMTATYKDYTINRYLPFYAETRIKESRSRTVMWPLYRDETIESSEYRLEKTSLLFFLFSRSDESWPQTAKTRYKNTFWPLYAWKRDEAGINTLSFPAPVEPVLWSDGIERNWAPLWRIFIARWDDKGDGATSILWNLYWRERRGTESAWELSPLVSFRSTRDETSFKLLKGLFGYGTEKGRKSLTVFWMPFGGGEE